MIGYGDSSTTHDFFAYNASGQVWNGSAFATWSDGSYASYRITATQTGTSGRFIGTAPTGTTHYELRVRGATLALSYVVWAESGPRESWSVVTDRTAALTIDKS